MIYFIADQRGRVKVGFSKSSPGCRMATLKTGNGDKLTLLGSIEGTVDDERDVHARLSVDRAEGGSEWYWMTARVVEFLTYLGIDVPAELIRGDDLAVFGRAKLTPPQVARILRVDVTTVHGWIRAGELRAINIASRGSSRPRFLVAASDLARFEKSREVTARPQGRRRQPTKPKSGARDFFDANGRFTG